MAGFLKVRLAGPIAYDGVMHEKSWIDSGAMIAQASDIRPAFAICTRTYLALRLAAEACAWLR